MKFKGITITKRKDGRYHAKIRTEDGYKYIYAKSEIECYEKLKLEFNAHTRTRNTYNLTVAEWVDKWIQVYKVNKVKDSTIKQIKTILRIYALPSIGNKKIKTIKLLEAEILLNNISSPRQKEKAYTILKDCFTRAFKNKVIKENIFDYIDKPKHEKKRSSALSNQQQGILLNALEDNKYKNLHYFLLYQGLRIGEALALNKDDIDFENLRITINKTLSEDGAITTPKTRDSDRVIPLFKKTLPYLESAFSESRGKRVFNFTYNAVYIDFSKLIEKTKLKGFTIHSLRHTFVTRCAEIGIASKVIQKWVGHSTSQITQDVYMHVNSDFEEASRQKIDTNFDTQI